MSLEKKLDFWIKNNLNVLFKGKAGCGKTTMVTEAFDRADLKWMYFSASTIDPFVDLAGIPREIKDPITGQSYLDLVRPKPFQDDTVQALFFDEYNRAPKKVRNAVMELIQFKSINGKKFNNLRVVWAAINPSDDETQKYDVEELDPAQLDRFQIQVDVPYAPHLSYFRNKFGDEMADVGITWWKELPAEVKNDVSPRRLDYALEVYKAGGDLRDVLPNKANINKLLTELVNGSTTKKLKKLFEDKDAPESKKFLFAENNFSACVDHIVKNKEYIKFFLPLLSDERISSLISKHKNVEDHALSNHTVFDRVLKEIAKAGTNKKLSQKILAFYKSQKVKNLLSQPHVPGSVKKHFTACDPELLPGVIRRSNSKIGTYKWSQTQARISVYKELDKTIPETMTLAQAEDILKFLMSIYSRSNESTKQKLPNLIPMMNHAISIIAGHNVTPKIDNYVSKQLDKEPEFIYNCEILTPAPLVTLNDKSASSPKSSNKSWGPRNW